MSCCIGNNPNEACGYPPQTVRAIISIFAVIISFMLFTFMAIWLSVNEKYTEAMGIVGVISTELGTIVGYYFSTRNKTEQKQELDNIERTATRIARRFELANYNATSNGGIGSDRVKVNGNSEENGDYNLTEVLMNDTLTDDIPRDP